MRSKPTSTDVLGDTRRDDGSRLLTMEEWEYRIPYNDIMTCLEAYGEAQTELVEDCKGL